MKKILIIISISLAFLGCKKSELEEVWIAKYHQSGRDSSLTNGIRQIYFFEKDSVTVKEFYRQFSGDTNESNKYAYEWKDEKLIIFNEGQNDTTRCFVGQDTLSKVYFNQSKYVYEKLRQYHQAKKSADFYDFLIHSSFEMIEDSLRIEFKNDSRFIKNRIDFPYGSNQFWMLDSFQNELFLVIDCSVNCQKTFLHIMEFDENGFKGMTYGVKNKAFIFKRLPKQKIFNSQDLVGNWERYYEPNYEFLTPPPPLPKSNPYYKKWYQKEQLMIDDKVLIQAYKNRTDTIIWSMNREQDLMLFEDSRRYSEDENIWKIIALNENELILERINRRNRLWNLNGDLFERVKFVRL